VSEWVRVIVVLSVIENLIVNAWVRVSVRLSERIR
jgi:hypothetical protein